VSFIARHRLQADDVVTYMSMSSFNSKVDYFLHKREFLKVYKGCLPPY